MKRTLFPGYSVGTDAYEDIKEICPAYGKKVAIIGGKHALAAAQDKIIAAAKEAGIEIIGPFWYGGEASVENIEMLKPKVADADMIFAVGGGKAIDTCKVLSHSTDRPFFTFPTIASTCASCTSLGILYHPDGSLREYSFSKIPPKHIFIDTQIIADAPDKYLWAGIGDTMAKHYECTVSSRGDIPAHSDAMGIALSSMCAVPMLRWGEKALADCRAHKVTDELTEVILGIIVSTGLVSNFVQVDYTTHGAVEIEYFFALFILLVNRQQNENSVGDYLSVQMMILFGALENGEAVVDCVSKTGLPTKLSDIHATPDDVRTVAEKALKGIDVRKYPYEVTEDMIVDAITELEKYNTEH